LANERTRNENTRDYRKGITGRIDRKEWTMTNWRIDPGSIGYCAEFFGSLQLGEGSQSMPAITRENSGISDADFNWCDIDGDGELRTAEEFSRYMKITMEM
jgi:hypothetical protein